MVPSILVVRLQYDCPNSLVARINSNSEELTKIWGFKQQIFTQVIINSIKDFLTFRSPCKSSSLPDRLEEEISETFLQNLRQ